jgi:hypothetical protein
MPIFKQRKESTYRQAIVAKTAEIGAKPPKTAQNPPNSNHPSASEIVRAAQVIAALRAHQLAMVSGELVAAVGADLAVVNRVALAGSLSPIVIRTGL